MDTADAVVIGGGVIGTSVAYRLSEQGRRTILVEKGSMASGASGACDKAVFLQSKKPGFHMELAKASMNIYEQLEEELGVPFEFKKSGGMIVIENESQHEVMQQFVRHQQAAGIDVRLLDGDEARNIQAFLSPHVIGATWSKEDAEVNPLLLTYAFKTAAMRLGAEIRTGTEVIGINSRGGKVSEVITNKGNIATNIVVNAAGAHAPRIGNMAGIPIPISPRRGIILISEKTKRFIQGNVLCAQYMTSKHQANSSSSESYSIGLSLGQTHSGNLLIGGSREFIGFNREATPHLLQAIANHACRIVPALKDIRIIRTMVGFRPFTPDGLPIIGETPQLKGFFIAAGHEGDGIALSPITGKLAANLIEGSGPSLHLAKPLSLERFTSERASSH